MCFLFFYLGQRQEGLGELREAGLHGAQRRLQLLVAVCGGDAWSVSVNQSINQLINQSINHCSHTKNRTYIHGGAHAPQLQPALHRALPLLAVQRGGQAARGPAEDEACHPHRHGGRGRGRQPLALGLHPLLADVGEEPQLPVDVLVPVCVVGVRGPLVGDWAACVCEARPSIDTNTIQRTRLSGPRPRAPGGNA